MKHRMHFVLGREVRERMKQFGRECHVPGEPLKNVPEEEQQKEETGMPDSAAADVVDNAPESAPWQPFTVVTRTDVGRVRQNNEDSVIDCGILCGVADGMGGHQAGETASATVRDGLISRLGDREPDPAELLAAIKAVNRRVFIMAQEDSKLRGMGTTVSVLWLGSENMHIGHVGDSRVYRLRKGVFEQMTEDHSLVGELVRAGVITPAEAMTHPMRNVITRAVGTEGGVDVDILSIPREAEDLWLVCSDGLYDMVTDAQMEKILKEHEVEEAADVLVQTALDAGGSDNVSVVLLYDREGAQ